MMEIFKDENDVLDHAHAQSVAFGVTAIAFGVVALIMIYKKPSAWQGVCALVALFLSAATGQSINANSKAKVATAAKSAVTAPPPATPPKVGPK